jgi:hypothetical protein
VITPGYHGFFFLKTICHRFLRVLVSYQLISIPAGTGTKLLPDLGHTRLISYLIPVFIPVLIPVSDNIYQTNTSSYNAYTPRVILYRDSSPCLALIHGPLLPSSFTLHKFNISWVKYSHCMAPLKNVNLPVSVVVHPGLAIAPNQGSQVGWDGTRNKKPNSPRLNSLYLFPI